MTDRKPAGVSWESWVERKIREAMESGAFDNLPGRGEPIPGLDRPHDELWWVRRKLRDEQINHLPPALALRQDVDEIRARISAAGTEAEVRRLVVAINDRIAYVNSHTTSGPPSDVMPFDVEQVLANWNQARSGLT